MIAATENIFAPAPLRDGAGAVAADVAECAESALLVANDDRRFADDVRGEKSFGIGDGTLCAVQFPARRVERSHELPGAAEDASFFSFENRGVDVVVRCEGVRAFDLFVDVGAEGHGGSLQSKVESGKFSGE